MGEKQHLLSLRQTAKLDEEKVQAVRLAINKKRNEKKLWQFVEKMKKNNIFTKKNEKNPKMSNPPMQNEEQKKVIMLAKNEN